MNECRFKDNCINCTEEKFIKCPIWLEWFNNMQKDSVERNAHTHTKAILDSMVSDFKNKHMVGD